MLMVEEVRYSSATVVRVPDFAILALGLIMIVSDSEYVKF